MSKLDLRMSKLQARIDELNFHKFPAKLTPDDFEDFAKTIQIAANLETKESRRILIDTFVDHVTVYPDHLHIVLNVAITSKNNDVYRVGGGHSAKPIHNFMSVNALMAMNNVR